MWLNKDGSGTCWDLFQQGRVTEHVITYVNYWMLTANVHITSRRQEHILPQKSHAVKQICLLENESIIITKALTKPETRLQFICIQEAIWISIGYCLKAYQLQQSLKFFIDVWGWGWSEYSLLILLKSAGLIVTWEGGIMKMLSHPKSRIFIRCPPQLMDKESIRKHIQQRTSPVTSMFLTFQMWPNSSSSSANRLIVFQEAVKSTDTWNDPVFHHFMFQSLIFLKIAKSWWRSTYDEFYTQMTEPFKSMTIFIIWLLLAD